jgi:alanyl-tRNA synthetase
MAKITAKELKQKYIKFFESKGHHAIHSASLIPENDPTVLFTTAGMHPLVPFLMGQPHPLGKRIVDVQKCIRTGDIDETGDTCHHTFFEMLGNWSLGDYFKKEAISWSYEFLTSKDWLGLDKNRLAFTCFTGDADCPRDEEAHGIWTSLGVSNDRIAYLQKKDNWWGPAGESGPCGPDSEMFYWTPNDVPAPKVYDPSDKRWVEIWNDVFMQYNKDKEGKYTLLKQQNVDTGLGVERVTAVLQGFADNYRTERFWPIIEILQEISGKKYEDYTKQMRIIADHTRAAVFILGDERAVTPGNVDQGYILRRFIRRVIRQASLIDKKLHEENLVVKIAEKIIEMYSEEYPELKSRKDFIIKELDLEDKKFKKTVEVGLKELEKIIINQAKGEFFRAKGKPPADENEILEFSNSIKEISLKGKQIFDLFQSHGLPPEMVFEEVEDAHAKKVLHKEETIKEFKILFEKHQELSRVGAEQKFKGGLSEASEITAKYHTATHLLGATLRKVLHDNNIKQKGSNITSERMRFDFNFDRKLTDEEVKHVEDEVNKIIQQAIPVDRHEMLLEDALKSGAQGEFGAKYPAKVSVYTMGTHSKEICMGPHASNTKDLGKFKIIKEESIAAGIRRIKAVLE